MKYAFIAEQRKNFSVASLCRALGVARNGFYAWLQAQNAPIEDDGLDDAIKAIFDSYDSVYGSPRIWQELRDQGWRVSEKRVAERMRTLGLVAKTKRKFKATTNSNHNLPVAPNLLEQDFTAEEKDRRWVADITYIWTNEGWLYLAAVLDLYSRAIVGWSMNARMTRQLVCDALTMAIWRRRPQPGLIAHSDRGSQYCSQQYQALLSAHGVLCSMSKKGDCYDNAAMESFFHSLKVERVHHRRYETREQAKQDVFEYIEVFYNQKRRHSTLNYKSPMQFEALAV